MRHALTALALSLAATAPAQGPALDLRPGDRIVFAGNTFAERLRHFGYFETQLLALHPDLQLTFRNIGWSADEITLQPRPLNFGDIHEHLRRVAADVIFLCYGLNESFKGRDGVEEFRQQLSKYLDDIQSHEYNGESPPRLVLVSPAPQEPMEFLPDTTARNEEIALYTEAMRETAAQKNVVFIDLFSPMLPMMTREGAPAHTINGIHFNEYGYWLAAQVMLAQLGIPAEPIEIALDARDGSARAQGAAISTVAFSPQRKGATLRVALDHLPAPAPPGQVSTASEWTRGVPRISVNGLAPGTYVIVLAGRPVREATAEELARGVLMDQGPWQDQMEAIRREVTYKNQLFFDRYRAVNGYYIYGGRKEPFGVLSFPPEMAEFDALTAKADGEINAMLQAPAPVELSIQPKESK
jgi:hypothetical protein